MLRSLQRVDYDVDSAFDQFSDTMKFRQSIGCDDGDIDVESYLKDPNGCCFVSLSDVKTSDEHNDVILFDYPCVLKPAITDPLKAVRFAVHVWDHALLRLNDFEKIIIFLNLKGQDVKR